jgi:2'-5' RNA ligase
MNLKSRRQLTLFLDDEYTTEIEKLRKRYNPVQFHLIRPHVTLCREEELEDLNHIKHNLRSLNLGRIRVNFDKLIRFSDQNGVMITAEEDNEQYHNLRRIILKGCDIPINFPEPHITLMHPRSSTCTDGIFNEIRKMNIPKSILFKEISLIQQTDGAKWETLNIFKI